MTVNLKDKGQSLRVVTQGWLSGGAPGSTTRIVGNRRSAQMVGKGTDPGRRDVAC